MTQALADHTIHIDVFSIIIFLGTVQGIFLSLFFLNKQNRQVRSNVYQGLLLLTISLISLDILISYTNVMFRMLHLVDITEPLNLLIGPFFYLYIVNKLQMRQSRKAFFHFLPALLYQIYIIPFIISGIGHKYNSYIDQYHPELPYEPTLTPAFTDPYFFKSLINELTIISVLIYSLVAIIKVYRASRLNRQSKSVFGNYSDLWITCAFMLTIIATVIFVKIKFTHDLGDFIIMIAVTLLIYFITIQIIRGSSFFDRGGENQK